MPDIKRLKFETIHTGKSNHTIDSPKKQPNNPPPTSEPPQASPPPPPKPTSPPSPTSSSNPSSPPITPTPPPRHPIKSSTQPNPPPPRFSMGEGAPTATNRLWPKSPNEKPDLSDGVGMGVERDVFVGKLRSPFVIPTKVKGVVGDCGVEEGMPTKSEVGKRRRMGVSAPRKGDDEEGVKGD